MPRKPTPKSSKTISFLQRCFKECFFEKHFDFPNASEFEVCKQVGTNDKRVAVSFRWEVEDPVCFIRFLVSSRIAALSCVLDEECFRFDAVLLPRKPHKLEQWMRKELALSVAEALPKTFYLSVVVQLADLFASVKQTDAGYLEALHFLSTHKRPSPLLFLKQIDPNEFFKHLVVGALTS